MEYPDDELILINEGTEDFSSKDVAEEADSGEEIKSAKL